MKKILASVIIASLIIGGAITYSTTHPEKQVTTVANQVGNITVKTVLVKLKAQISIFHKINLEFQHLFLMM